MPVVAEVFSFLNKSDHEVRITDLEPSCGCLVPQITSRVIGPGAAGQITLPIRTASETPGLHEYLVVVKYADPQPRQVTLTWRVILPEKQLRVEPKVLMVLGSVSAEDTYDIMISDHRNRPGEPPMQVTSVLTSSPLFAATVEGLNLTGPVPTTKVSVRFQPPIPPGRHRGLVQIMTDDPVYPCLDVPVITGGPQRPADQAASASPESAMVVVDVHDVAASQGTVVTFDVPSQWTVTHCDVFPPQLSAALETESATGEGRMSVPVTLSVNAQPEVGVERGVIALHATSGDQPQLVTVPITIRRKSPPDSAGGGVDQDHAPPALPQPAP